MKLEIDSKELKILITAMEHLLSNIQAGNTEIDYGETLKLFYKIERI